MRSLVDSQQAAAYLHRLCMEIPGRRVGSPGNRAATDWVAGVLASLGFDTESPPFDCIDWSQEGATLTVDGEPFAVLPSPYTLGGRLRGPLTVISTVAQLESAGPADRIILLRGELVKEQLMPKNFGFYNPPEHRHIVHLLETQRPAAIIAATSRNPELAGAVYPFPLIEDGDFDIPSVYATEEEGDRLARRAGREAVLEVRAARTPARGCNVIARRGADPGRRVVLFAHVDAKDGTPGATDNASGVVVLLLLAGLLADYAGTLGIEIVALNGEDYYSAPGEQQYLELNAGRWDQILLGINLDGVGYRPGKTAYSLYDCPADLVADIHALFAAHAELMEGEPWYQGDHGLFLMHQRPALAITSERFGEILADIAHTPRDHPEIVDVTKLVAVALALRDLVLHLDQRPRP